MYANINSCIYLKSRLNLCVASPTYGTTALRDPSEYWLPGTHLAFSIEMAPRVRHSHNRRSG